MVVVEVLQVVAVLVRSEVADGADSDAKAVGDVEAELRAQLEAAALDVRAHPEVSDRVVPREKVPVEREMGLRRVVEELLFRGLRGVGLLRGGRGADQERDEREGSSLEIVQAVTFVNAS